MSHRSPICAATLPRGLGGILSESHFVRELLLLLAVAAAGVALFERLRLPAVAGFLVMGAAVGPGGLALVDDPDRVRALAEFGVVFLLFEIGLELPSDRLRTLWQRAVWGGGLQVALTLLLVAAAARALGLDWPSALVLGALVALSSTALVMRLLSERGEVDAPHGQTAVAVLIFQDLCIVPFLLLLPILAGAGAQALGLELGRAALALLVFVLAARFGLPLVIERAARLRSPELFTLIAFILVVGSAVAAEAIGLTLSVGAFLAGLVLSTSPYATQLFSEVIPLRGVLIGLFFTAVGMLLDPRAALGQAPEMLGYLAGVVVLKAGIVVLVVTFALRQGLRLGVLTGAALAQTGEFSFVLAEEAARSGLLDPALHQVFVAGSVGTLLLTPFLMSAAPALAGRLRGLGGAPAPADEPEAAPLADHGVLIGFGLAGRTLARVLASRDIPYCAVEANARTVAASREQGIPIVYGDATRRGVLEALGVPRARLVSVAISDPLATREVVRLARALAPYATVIARTRYVAEVDQLAQAGASEVVVEEFESGIELLAATLRAFGTPQSSIQRFTAELREEGYEPLRGPASLPIDPWLAELLEQVDAEWVDVPEALEGEPTLTELGVRARTGASILAFERAGTTTPNPPPDQALRAGDRLLAFGAPDAVARLRDLLAGGSAGRAE
ncbi:MAG: cation:proton antiporter [Myxococcota bacterium]|nr:cation:proton antiporter [Myxococcota bacterium]